MAGRASTIQMYSNAVQDAAASIDMQDDGVIVGCYLGFRVSSVAADTDGAAAEVSFASTNSFTVNDARNVIARGEISAAVITAASAIAASFSNFWSFGEGLPFFGGERIFLHTQNLTGGLLERAHALLIIEFKGGPISRRR